MTDIFSTQNWLNLIIRPTKTWYLNDDRFFNPQIQTIKVRNFNAWDCFLLITAATSKAHELNVESDV